MLGWALFVDRGVWEPLGEAPLAYANWSRDGQSFTGYGGTTIARWSRASGQIEAVVDIGEIPRVIWPAAAWMGLTHDGSPLIVRDRSTRDLYALDWEAP